MSDINVDDVINIIHVFLFQILCVSNFQDDDRSRVKQMILALGARYTSYMTHANSALICKQYVQTSSIIGE